MKALTKFFAIILVLAIATAVVGFAMEGFDIEAFAKAAKIITDSNYELVEQTESGAFNSVKIDATSNNIEFSDSNDENFHISYYTLEDYADFDYTATDGEISLVQERFKFKLSTMALSINLNKADVITVKVPSSFSGKINLKTSSGSVLAKTACMVETASLEASSGNVKLENTTVRGSVSLKSSSGRVTAQGVSAGGGLDLNTSSGDIKAENTTARESVSMQASSGSITAQSVSATGDFKTKTLSGDIRISDSSADSLDAHATSGRVTLSGTAVIKTIKADSSSGDIKLTDITANGIDAKTASGRITVKAAGKKSDYRIDVHTSSGIIRVGGTRINNNSIINDDSSLIPLKAYTSSGDITIEFAD